MRDPELEAFARRCEQIYEARYKALLEATQRDKFIALEAESGDYFLGETMSEAGQAFRAAYPDRLYHMMRVGHPAALYL